MLVHGMCLKKLLVCEWIIRGFSGSNYIEREVIIMRITQNGTEKNSSNI